MIKFKIGSSIQNEGGYEEIPAQYINTAPTFVSYSDILDGLAVINTWYATIPGIIVDEFDIPVPIGFIFNSTNTPTPGWPPDETIFDCWNNPSSFATLVFFLTEVLPDPPSSIKFGGTSMVTGEQALKNLQANHGAISVFNNNSGLGAYGPVQNQDYPIFQDNLSHYVPWATLKAFVNGTLALSWTQGSFTLPDSGGQTQKMLPSELTAIAGELTKVEPNTNDFFTKQEHVWEAEAAFFDFVVKEIEDRCEETKISYTPETPTLPEGLTEDSQTFGPFVVLTRDSESNKGYKYNNLAGWAYRSLIKTIEFEIVQKTVIVSQGQFSAFASFMMEGVGLIETKYVVEGNGFVIVPAQYQATAPNHTSVAQILANIPAWNTWFNTLPNHKNNPNGLVLDGTPAPEPPPNEQYTRISFLIDGGAGLLLVVFSPVVDYATSYLLNKSESQISPCVTTNLGFTEIIGHGQYDLLGVFSQTDSTPEPYSIPDPCLSTPVRTSTVLLGDSKIVDPSSLLALDTTIDSQLFHIDVPPLIIPPSTILLRDGSPAPIYPVKEGAYVYDLHLKKWGKLRQQYKELLDFSPINSQSSQVYPHEVFGIQAAMVDGNGNFYVFDDKPIESEMVYGKIGFHRKGMTAIEELHAQFKKTSTGEVVVESSLDGKTIDPSLSRISSFEDAIQWKDGFSVVARWFNVKIRGIWDLCYLQFTGHKKGNR